MYKKNIERKNKNPPIMKVQTPSWGINIQSICSIGCRIEINSDHIKFDTGGGGQTEDRFHFRWKQNNYINQYDYEAKVKDLLLFLLNLELLLTIFYFSFIDNLASSFFLFNPKKWYLAVSVSRVQYSSYDYSCLIVNCRAVLYIVHT